jgi:lipid A 4'-phosphatase
MSRPLAFLLAALFAAALFTLAPQIDLWVSGLFWRSGEGFFLAQLPAVRFLYRAVLVLTWLIAIPLSLYLIFVLICVLGATPRFPALARHWRAALYLLLALAIGPGLIVNTAFKDHWGRARPSQVTEFGGTQQFTPAFLPSLACERNCSFVSGHAALGFYLVSFAFLVPMRRRRLAIAAAVAAGGLFGLVRIAQGAHFLSDVVFAGFLVTASSWLLHRLLIANDLLANERIAAWSAVIPWRWLLAWSAATGAAILLSILFLDRPLAVFFRGQDERLRGVFEFITQFGLSKGWLIGAALIWFALIAAARLPRFAARAAQLIEYSRAPLLFFTALAASGLVVDLVKIIAGRTRPKLLFSDGIFAFTGWSTHADHWSFPSGHTANAVAIALALSAIAPRGRPLYILFALLIAASRIVITQHYLSDVMMGAFVALLTTECVRFVFAQSAARSAAAQYPLNPRAS